jgi:hypothetical protein
MNGEDEQRADLYEFTKLARTTKPIDRKRSHPFDLFSAEIEEPSVIARTEVEVDRYSTHPYQCGTGEPRYCIEWGQDRLSRESGLMGFIDSWLNVLLISGL